MFCPAQTQPALHILTLALPFPTPSCDIFLLPALPCSAKKKVILSITVFSGNCVLPFSSESFNSYNSLFVSFFWYCDFHFSSVFSDNYNFHFSSILSDIYKSHFSADLSYYCIFHFHPCCLTTTTFTFQEQRAAECSRLSNGSELPYSFVKGQVKRYKKMKYEISIWTNHFS